MLWPSPEKEIPRELVFGQCSVGIGNVGGSVHSASQALKLWEDLLPDMRCPCEKHIAMQSMMYEVEL